MCSATWAESAPPASTVCESYCSGPALCSMVQVARKSAPGRVNRYRALMAEVDTVVHPGLFQQVVNRYTRAAGVQVFVLCMLCTWRVSMLHWSLVLLVIALIAAILGFGGLAGTAV